MKLPWKQDAEAARKVTLDELALPETPHHVELTMPTGERLPARIAGREGDELLILMMVPAARPLTDAQLREIVVELAGDGGLIRLAGAAVMEDRDLLRFRDLHSLELLQRRDYVRVQATRSVLVSVTGSLAMTETSSVNLSGGGMLLSGLEHLKIGERVQFRLTTDEDGPEITGTGKVVRSDSGGRRAIAFESISDGNRRRLIRFLFDCQREERRKGLLGGGDGR